MSTFLTEFLLVFSLQMVAVIMPGPDNILVMNNANTYSRKHGIFTGLGISIGAGIQVIACLLGLALIIKESTELFTLISGLSAVYLAYLGGKILASYWKQKTQSSATKVTSSITYRQALLQGLLCNLLNPKATLFFLGLFTLVINEHTPLSWQSIYAAAIVLTAFAWFSTLSILLTHSTGQYYMQKIQHVLQPLFGILLIVYAVLIIWDIKGEIL
jgi:RhtB (resistance to homoserine/threonine) family protein